jgi:hypothetical protein
LFQKCENCDNFAPTLQLDWTKTFVNEKIQKILNSDAPEMEKRLLVAYEIEPSHQALLNLYWYYDINNQEKIEKYRDLLIKQFEEAYDDEQSRYALRMYVELLRRRGDFRKAIRFAKKDRFLPNNAINRSLEMSSPNESAIIKQEIELCKTKDGNKHLFEHR